MAEIWKELGWELCLQRLLTQHLADGDLVTAVQLLHSILAATDQGDMVWSGWEVILTSPHETPPCGPDGVCQHHPSLRAHESFDWKSCSTANWHWSTRIEHCDCVRRCRLMYDVTHFHGDDDATIWSTFFFFSFQVELKQTYSSYIICKKNMLLYSIYIICNYIAKKLIDLTYNTYSMCHKKATLQSWTILTHVRTWRRNIQFAQLIHVQLAVNIFATSGQYVSNRAYKFHYHLLMRTPWSTTTSTALPLPRCEWL